MNQAFITIKGYFFKNFFSWQRFSILLVPHSGPPSVWPRIPQWASSSTLKCPSWSCRAVFMKGKCPLGDYNDDCFRGFHPHWEIRASQPPTLGPDLGGLHTPPVFPSCTLLGLPTTWPQLSPCCAHSLAQHQACLLQAWLSSGVTSCSLSTEHAPSSEDPQSFSYNF